MSTDKLETVYMPSNMGNGYLYEIEEVVKHGITYLTHNNSSKIVDTQLIFKNTPENLNALGVLYPDITFDTDVYLYNTRALDKLLEHSSPILCVGEFNSKKVYVNVVKEADGYYIDDFGCEWIDLTPVKIHRDGNISEKRVLKYGN